MPHRTLCVRWLTLVGAIAAMVAGCGSRGTLDRRAEAALDRMTAAPEPIAAEARAEPVNARPAETIALAPAEMSLYLVPISEADTPVEGEAKEAAAETPAAQGVGSSESSPLEGMTFKQVIVEDLREMPASLGRGFKHAFAKPENLAILGAAFGADRVVRHNWDENVREYFARHENQTSLSATGDFGSVIGNPGLHIGIGLLWYAAAVHNGDAEQHEKSKVLLEALLVNDMATEVFKFSMDDDAPNDERWGWPSGHFSSSLCFASVVHEYYGVKAAIPLYLVAGYSGATRLADREHDLSDLVFGGALGLVVGHSIVKGELPQVAGFQVLPYGGRGVGGVMLVRSW